MSSKSISNIIERFATETLIQEDLENIFGDCFGRKPPNKSKHFFANMRAFPYLCFIIFWVLKQRKAATLFVFCFDG